MKLQFSIIIPVYNRPNEIDELLDSLCKQTYKENFEVVIVEDGSENKADAVVDTYRGRLTIKYLFKENTGAGLSRNFGMKNAMGNYFIILDSDVIVPINYLEIVAQTLENNYTDAYGGPDAAHASFNTWQKAINYAMTSFLTTGGLRGGKQTKSKFQLRSFNLGISKKAFKATNGFGNRKIGEDIDLTFRLWKLEFATQLIPDAFVYHKRRTSIKQFFKQTYNFGKERPLLNRQYPATSKLTFWFPTLFVLGAIVSFVLSFLHCFLPMFLLLVYILAIFIDASIKNKSVIIGITSVVSTFIQFFGYGIGYLVGLKQNGPTK